MLLINYQDPPLEILPQLLANSLIAGSIYALASAGLSLSYGLLRVLNFAHGHIMMTGAYCFYCVSVQYQFGLVTASVLTFLFALLLSYVTLHVFVQPFTRYSFMLTFITTLALSTMLESVVAMLFGVNVKSLSPGSAAQSFEVYGVYVTPIQVFIIVSAVLLLGLLGTLIHHTRFGRMVRALSQHSQGAQALGVNHSAASFAVFSLGIMYACYAGVLVGFETNLQPTMGTPYTIKAFAAMVLGGLGNIWGTVIGAYLLGLIENLSIGLDFGWGEYTFTIPAGYKDAFAYAIILLVLLFRPEGLFAKRSRKA